MTDDPLWHCVRCRWSVNHQAANLEPVLFCKLLSEPCAYACHGYERYPGAEGEDD